MEEPVYLDYNATTPLDPAVAAQAEHWLRVEFRNPSSAHRYGRSARRAVDDARGHVADLIGARPGEIVFTGSATEANNLALLGVARARPERRHIVISAIEHPAVAEPARHLRETGWDVSVVPVDRTGRVSPNDVRSALRPDTVLVSIMHANNEVGTLQPIREIASVVSGHGILFHTDAAQSIGKVRVNVEELGVDLLTIARHKCYAPKGVGALHVRTQVPIQPVLFGGDQESGLRPGTENVALIVGLGAACRLAGAKLPQATTGLASLRNRLQAALMARVPGLSINGHPVQRLPNTLHVSFPGVSGADLLASAATSVAASTGSACHAGSETVSGTLAALGVGPELARGAVRLSVGLPTTEPDIDRASAGLVEGWRALAHRRAD